MSLGGHTYRIADHHKCQVQPKSFRAFVITGIVVGGGFALILFAIATITWALRKFRKMELAPLSSQNAYKLAGHKSVYIFILSSNPLCWLVSMCTIVFPISVLFTFLQHADFGADDSDWVYDIVCPRGSFA